MPIFTTTQKDQILEKIRKILKDSGRPPHLLCQIDIEETSKGIEIILHVDSPLNLNKKTEKNISRVIKRFYEKFKNKNCNKEIILQYRESPKPQNLNNLQKAIDALKPNPKTSLITVQSKAILISRNLIELSFLVTLLGDFIWPELSGAKVDKLYLKRPENLIPKGSPESNAVFEAEYLLESLRPIAINLRDIIAQFSSIGELNKIENISHKLMELTRYIVLIHKSEGQREFLGKIADNFIKRYVILKRVCKSVDEFYSTLTKEDVPILWSFYQEYKEKIPIYLRRLDDLVDAYEESYKQSEEFFSVGFSLCSRNSDEIKKILNQEKDAKKVNNEKRRQSLIDKNDKIEDKLLLVNESENDSDAVERTDVLYYQNQAIQQDEKFKRKKELKEAKNHNSLEIEKKNSDFKEEVDQYNLTNGTTMSVTFSINDIDVYCIHSALNFYALKVGLVHIPPNFLKVIINKEDRNFLSLIKKGMSGIKMLAQDILVVKPHDSAERLILMGIKVEEKTFFLPVAIVEHAKWEIFAMTPDHIELMHMRSKLHSIFTIRNANAISKMNNPLKPLPPNLAESNFEGSENITSSTHASIMLRLGKSMKGVQISPPETSDLEAPPKDSFTIEEKNTEIDTNLDMKRVVSEQPPKHRPT